MYEEIGFDTAEHEPSKVCFTGLTHHIILLSLLVDRSSFSSKNVYATCRFTHLVDARYKQHHEAKSHLDFFRSSVLPTARGATHCSIHEIVRHVA